MPARPAWSRSLRRNSKQQQPAEAPKQEEPIQGPTFRTGVDLVAIDVAVVDRRGRPVEDLRAPEFAVKIDGEVRRVVSAELVKVDVEAAKKQVADKTESFYTSNLTPPNGRQIVIAVDQINIRPGSLRPVLAAAARFLDRPEPARSGGVRRLPRARARASTSPTTSCGCGARCRGWSDSSRAPRPGSYNIGVSEAICDRGAARSDRCSPR